MRKESRLLYSESPTVFQKSLACAIGLNSAIFLQQLNFWLTIAEQEQAADQWFEGRWWVRNTYAAWVEKHFPFWSIATIRRIVTYLEEDLHVILSRPDSSQNSNGKWYTIDYDALEHLDVLPADIGRRLAIAETAREAGAVLPEEPVDEPDPEPAVERLQAAPAARHVRAHTQYRGIVCGSSGCHPIPECAATPAQNEQGPLRRMSKGGESECAVPPAQNEQGSRLRLKELKNQSKTQIKTQKGSGRVLSAPASPPLIPPTAPVRRTGAVVLQLSPQGDPRPIGHNQWAEPAWRSRVVEARAEYKHRRDEET